MMLAAGKTKNSRKALAKFEGEKVFCTGRFMSAKIFDNGFTNLLFRDVVVNGKYKYDHLWIVNNKNFTNIGIKYGCDVSFTGIVQKYENADRYGISYCSDVEIIQYNPEIEDEEFLDINIQFKTVKYSDDKYNSNASMKGYQNFIYDYDLELKTRCRLVYSPAKTFFNKDGEIEFEAYDSEGHMAEFSKISFNPKVNSRSITIDDKYCVKTTETTYRELSLLYFLVKSSGYGCMVYMPEEERMDYIEIVDMYKKTYYYMSQFMFSVDKNRVIGKPAQKAGVI